MYLKYSYKFETLVPFKVIPLSLDAEIPALLLLLETLSKLVHWKFNQGPPAILIGPLHHQQNASFSNPASSMGTKNGARSKVRQVGGVGHNHHFVFSQKLLAAQVCVGGGIVVVQEPIPTLPLFWAFSLQALAVISTHSSKTADLLLVLEEKTPYALSLQHQKNKSNFS